MTQANLIFMAILAMGITIAHAEAQSTGENGQSVRSGQSVQSFQNNDTTAEPAASNTTSSKSAKHHKKRSHLEIGASYLSNDVYLGRRDSAALPYLIPAISYYHKSGLYASVSLNYLKNSTADRIDLFTLEGGYMFTTHKYDGVFSVSKYFYNSQSTNLASDIKAAIAYQNGYDLGLIKPSVTATVNIGDKVDFEGRFELSHAFSLLGDKLDLTPTIGVAGSTLNYYDYYRRRRYKITKKKVVQTGIASVTSSVLHPSTFKIMDYEPTIPIEYTLGKCTLSFTPTYSIPVNPATIAVQTVRDDGTTTNRTKAEKIGNNFYFMVGASIMF